MEFFGQKIRRKFAQMVSRDTRNWLKKEKNRIKFAENNFPENNRPRLFLAVFLYQDLIPKNRILKRIFRIK